MFHPIMPFFTEHLWDQASNILKNDIIKINKSEWPKGISVDEKDNIKINLLIELISSIRSTRSEMNVPANAVIDINYSKISNELGAIFDEHKETIQSLTRSKSITEKNFSKDEGMVQVIFNDGLIYLSLKGIIDFEQEKNRLQKSLSKIEIEMNKINEKLESDKFIQNAPEEIIDEQKNRHKEYLLSKEKIEMAIKSLG
jgi:valyl-tRNA synthetase